MDGQAWAALRETDLLNGERKSAPFPESEHDEWRQERERAKLRWIDDSVEESADVGDVPSQANDMDRLRRHEAETRTLLDAQSNRRPAFVAGLIAVLVLVLVGIGVWRGQSGNTKIEAAFAGKLKNCAQPPGEGVVWSGCVKNEARLSQAPLRNANLVGTHLERADLTGADLSYANLGSADLRGANLSGAILKGATLNQADLTGADLTGADLSFAVMSGALLNGARLDGTVLRQSTWLDGRICSERSVGICQ
ncbi:MAG: hypothetical protein AUJ86_11295 [Hydrogenophilaceae bacterium CG1_02_62_390]|nr:MAG: hypothetical protein AUJ86_11295 [Hydrogenophilaceae bacterium CG1_02_62_390]